MRNPALFIALLYVSSAFASPVAYPARLVRGRNGMILEIDGKRVYPQASRFLPGFKSEKLFLADPGPVREFSDQGVKIAFVGTELGWRKDGKYDYSAVDRQLRKALEDPSVYIIPAIDMRWRTGWWPLANPGERYTRMVKGKQVPRTGMSTTASFFSDKFRDEASEALRHYIRHIEEQGWAHRVLGYQVNWGRAAEWIAWEHLADLNPHAVAAFRKFLKEKYNGDVAALRKAWKDETVDFATAYPAANMWRTADRDGYINDPAEGRRIPDYVECYRRRTTDMLLHFMGVVKDATGGKALAGTYASPGYYYQQFERIAASDRIDFGVSSSSYLNRTINGVYLTQAISLETFRKNGKLYWHDADARTHLWPEERFRGSENIYESLMSSLRRDFGSVFVKSAGITWFSLNQNRNVFGDRAIMDDIGRIRALCDSALRFDADLSSSAEAAVVYDPENIFRNPYRSNAPFYVSYIKTGIPVDFYPVYDLGHLVKAKKQYKLVVLLGCGTLTGQQREWIKALRGDRRTLLFMYANGIVDGDRFDPASSGELSGFRYEFVPGADTKVNIAPAWRDRFGASMPLPGQINAPSGARRLRIIPTEKDEVIAVSGTDGKAAWVRRRYPDWTAIQFPGYQTYPAVLRRIAESSGIRIIYPYSDGSYQSCRDFVCVTGGIGGTRKLALDCEAIYDIFSDEIIRPVDGSFPVRFLPYETKLFFSGTLERAERFRGVYTQALKDKGSAPGKAR